MSAGALTLEGRYYDGRRPLPVPATLFVAGRQAVLIGERLTERFARSTLRVSPRVARSNRFIALPNGGQLECADDPRLDLLPQEVPSEGLVAWLEQRVAVTVASIALTAVVLLSGYVYGLPVLAEKVAARVPIETERELGEKTLAWLDEHEWFEASELDEDIRGIVSRGFDELKQGLPTEPHLRLEFRKSFVGPNAFALPGGVVVVTDAMVRAGESPDEVLAVLAHEIGHVEHRHTLRHLVQDSALAVVIATLTADAATLGGAVAGLPVVLARAKYSRDFESEADAYAFELLKERGRSPESFAALMERLSGKREKANQSFLSSHPVTAERVERARAAVDPDAPRVPRAEWPDRDWRGKEDTGECEVPADDGEAAAD
ncbi:peptidase M48 [Sulfurifustis variabilis]|uniref:Peptidase M48 n=1 Tax=Sulfurifustis variabilis TaxID=1675686 RepID=A0A1B4V542_9GAMM|nr:M48 family metallopeptidase [Sulfurifustis variabilis]BAU48646.1 peptidase M48 [Sulfurifustis variabilis]